MNDRYQIAMDCHNDRTGHVVTDETTTGLCGAETSRPHLDVTRASYFYLIDWKGRTIPYSGYCRRCVRRYEKATGQ